MQLSDHFVFQRKVGGNWYFAIRIDGKKIHRSLKTTDKDKAEKLARDIYNGYLRQQSQEGFVAAIAPASECFEVYKERRLRGRSDKDLKIHDSYVKRYLSKFGDVPLTSLSTWSMEDFRDWLLQQPIDNKNWTNQKILSVKTVKQILGWLSSVYKYHKLENPCVGIQPPKLAKEEKFERAIRFYSDNEVKNIFEAAGGLIFEQPLKILWYSGLRPAELRYVRNDPKHIDKEHQVLTIIDKKADVRRLDLANNSYTMKAWEAMLEWIERQRIEEGALLFPYGPNWFSQRWSTVLKHAKLSYVRTHQIRHQFVKTAFHKLGWDMTTISQWCGHQTDMCYQTYSKVLLQSPVTNDDPDSTNILSPAISKGYHFNETLKLEFLLKGQARVDGKLVEVAMISVSDFEKIQAVTGISTEALYADIDLVTGEVARISR